VAAVEIETKGSGVRWIRLNRPEKLNAVNDELRIGLHQALEQASSDDDVRVIVLTGNGRAFCAGGDVGGQQGRSPNLTVKRMFRGAPLLSSFASCEKPTIAALNGLAAGAGAGLTLHCDITYAAEDAWMAFVFVERGLVPDFGSTYHLPRAIGVARARELMLTARRVYADEARELGLVSAVFPKEEFEERVQERAEQIATGNTEVMPLIRRLVNHSFEIDFRSALEREALAQGFAAGSDDHHRAVHQFLARSTTRA
jgi:2-(1,2-epoxy-1,2-dihydrophenyl)acetyl-CoA isomerase